MAAQLEIIPLSEGSFTIDKSKRFVPFTEGADSLSERSKGSLLVEIQPFVVRTSERVLLLDAGLGYTDDEGVLQLHRNMVAAGVDPLEVTDILMTHLHRDHSGGLVLEDTLTGRRYPSFPQARIHIQEEEFEHAFRTDGPSYPDEELTALAGTDLLCLHRGEGGIGENIRFMRSGGHSPFHQVFWIREGGETVFFGGDEAPQLMQMRKRIVAKYDHDGERAADLRQAWWEQGCAEHWTFLFYHDIRTPSIRC